MDPFEFLAGTNIVKNEIISTFTRLGYSVNQQGIKDEMLSFRIKQGKKNLGALYSPFKLEAGKRHFVLSDFKDIRKKKELVEIIRTSRLFRESGMELKSS